MECKRIKVVAFYNITLVLDCVFVRCGEGHEIEGWIADVSADGGGGIAYGNYCEDWFVAFIGCVF